jgi:charged multivesicular body protein 4
MFGWFTKKKEEKNSASIHQTIEGMRTTIDDLEKKEAQLQKRADEEVENARKYVQAKNRTAAGECLKKKKRYEEQMKRIQTQKDNIETQILQLESSALDVEVLKTQQKGAQVS